MIYIQTPDDWWSTVDYHWDHLLGIFARVGAPLGGDETGHWWDGVRHNKTLIQTLYDAQAESDHKTLRDLLGKVWMAAPDDPRIHRWESWGDLCDLCSEDWVFHETEYT